MSNAKHFLCLILIMMTASLAFAAPPETELSDAAAAGEAATSAAGKKKATARRVGKFQEYSLGLLLWQEDINATRATVTAPMRTQSLGIDLGWNWNNFFAGSNWRQWHTVDFTVGQVKGKGSGGIPDELKKQSFYMVQGAPGLMWRNSPVSEIGFAIPLAYRMIKWDLIPSSGLSMDKKSSFSAGVSLTYVGRFTARNSLNITIANQRMWNTTMWNVGFNRVF